MSAANASTIPSVVVVMIATVPVCVVSIRVAGPEGALVAHAHREAPITTRNGKRPVGGLLNYVGVGVGIGIGIKIGVGFGV